MQQHMILIVLGSMNCAACILHEDTHANTPPQPTNSDAHKNHPYLCAYAHIFTSIQTYIHTYSHMLT